MNSLSVWHLLIMLSIAVLLLSGRNKISGIMGDFAQGLNAFKKGLAESKDARPEIIGFLFVILGVLGLIFAVTRQ